MLCAIALGLGKFGEVTDVQTLTEAVKHWNSLADKQKDCVNVKICKSELAGFEQ